MNIIYHLRNNGRIPLTTLSKKTHIPVAQLYEYLKGSQIKIRPTILISFSSFGYLCRSMFSCSVPINMHAIFLQEMKKLKYINSLYNVLGESDFIGEAIFSSKQEADNFFDELSKNVSVKRLSYSYIIEDIMREQCFTSLSHFN